MSFETVLAQARAEGRTLLNEVEAKTLLKEAGITPFIADQNMSVIEGSLGILPRRVLVPDDRAEEARRILRDAGVE